MRSLPADSLIISTKQVRMPSEKSPRTLEKQEFKAEADSGKNKASQAETYGKLSVQQYQLVERELKPDKIFLTTIKPGIKQQFYL